MPMLRIAALSSLAVCAALLASPSYALTAKECSTKYQAAKEAGTLDGMKWNDFRKANCGADATAAEETAPAKKAKKGKTAAAADDADGKGLSMKECSAKYQAAKEAGTLDGMKWNDFRKANCGADAAAAEEMAPAKKAKKGKTAAAADDADSKGLSMKECSTKYQTAKADGTLNGMKWNDFRKANCGASASDDDSVPSMDEANYTNEPEAPAGKAPKGVTFPRGLDKKFASETPGKQRLHTCLEGYYDNKDRNTLNGLRWIQKGGGYYSLCNARLKGNS